MAGEFSKRRGSIGMRNREEWEMVCLE